MQRLIFIKRLSLTAALLLFVSTTARAQPIPPVATDGAGQPVQPFVEMEPEKRIEIDIKNLIQKLNDLRPESNQGNFEMSSFISKARTGYFGASEWTENFVALRGTRVLYLDSFKIEKLDGDAAQVQVGIQVLNQSELRKLRDGEKLEE